MIEVRRAAVRAVVLPGLVKDVLLEEECGNGHFRNSVGLGKSLLPDRRQPYYHPPSPVRPHPERPKSWPSSQDVLSRPAGSNTSVGPPDCYREGAAWDAGH